MAYFFNRRYFLFGNLPIFFEGVNLGHNYGGKLLDSGHRLLLYL